MQQNTPGETRNLLIAVALSTGIMFGWQYFFSKPSPHEGAQISYQRGGLQPGETPPEAAASPALGGSAASAPAGRSVAFETETLHGSLNLRGGRLESLSLKKYHETADPASGEVKLLYPEHGGYFMESGLLAAGGQTVALPGKDALWNAPEGASLAPNKPLVLTWEQAGVKVERVISVAGDYTFTVKDTVSNGSKATLRLASYASSDRPFPGTEHDKGSAMVHRGAVAGEDGVVRLETYDDIQKQRYVSTKGVSGWIGLTDHYWLTAALPPQNEKSDLEIRAYRDAAGALRVQAGFIGEERQLAPGSSATFNTVLYAGAKELHALEQAQSLTGAERFDRVIDFGWVYFISKPLFVLVTYLRSMLGNFGLAIIALTCIVRGVLYPLANRSYIGMQRMKALQPRIEQIRKAHEGDAMRINQETMKLYQKEKVNPLTSGCLPMLLQFPVFYALYKVLLVSIEMRHAPFYGWIHDLSAPDPLNIFTLFGFFPWDHPAFLQVGILPMMVAGTMYVQQLLSPQTGDPTQAQIMRMMPFFFLFVTGSFPAGLALYWFVSNLLSIAQQAIIVRRFAKRDAALAAKHR